MTHWFCFVIYFGTSLLFTGIRHLYRASYTRHRIFKNYTKRYTRAWFVCFYPFTREGGHTPSGGAWDPKWGFDSYFFI